ncbi:MAG: hypothetical protein AAGF06_00810 [Pseudomonadota bacterium]
MKEMVKTAGFFAAHALWSVSDCEGFTPIMGTLNAEGEQTLGRLVGETKDVLRMAKSIYAKLADNDHGGAFVQDGYANLDTGRIDAVVVNVMFKQDESKRVQFLIPYRRFDHAQGFAVHRVKISDLQGFESDDQQWMIEMFFEGLESHPEGGKIWSDQYEDQPLTESTQSSASSESVIELTASDFEVLQRVPFVVFFLVAGADGEVDKKEIVKFMKIMAGKTSFEHPLLNQIIETVRDDMEEMSMSMQKEGVNYLEELEAVRAIVDRSLTPEQANAFKISLFKLGQQIAEASGGLFGFGAKIGKEEEMVLRVIAGTLEIKA